MRCINENKYRIRDTAEIAEREDEDDYRTYTGISDGTVFKDEVQGRT
jgi:hypothetical protein